MRLRGESGLVDVNYEKGNISIHSIGTLRPDEAWDLILEIESALAALSEVEERREAQTEKTK